MVSARDVARLGDLTGKDVLHLSCHVGTDTVSLSRLGPRRTSARHDPGRSSSRC